MEGGAGAGGLSAQLHDAAERGDAHTVRQLLRDGANVNDSAPGVRRPRAGLGTPGRRGVGHP